jgi:hypothetical protein
MSAPDSPSSKARPSLLSETAKSAADNDSRILANLEGRVAAQPNPTRRSNKLWIVVAAAALGLSALGAWQWQRASRDDGHASPRVASTLDGVQKPAAAPAASAAAATVIADASGAAADTLKTAAPSPQPAVIVADTATNDRPASAPAGARASAATAAPAATGAIGASGSDSERLSRALSDGASASGSAAAPAAHAKSAVAVGEATKTTKTTKTTAASHTVHEADKKHQAQRVASAHQRRDANAGAKKTDQDVDLLAAIVARTKPYDANHGKTPTKAGAAQKTQTATSGVPGLAERVAECSTRGLLEGQFCRWHVCADHWGKDPACPSSTFQSAGSSN